MMNIKFKNNLIFKLILAVILGIVIGQISNTQVIGIINTIKYTIGQLIFFVIPLIILGFIAPSITKMKANAGKMLFTMILLSYISSIGAALFSMILGYLIIPNLSISPIVDGLQKLPKLIFMLDVPPVMSVMSALVLSIMLGLAVIATKSTKFEDLLNEFNNIVLKIVSKFIIPLLPIFIFSTFACLSYEGSITKQLPVFIKIILIVIISHYIWLTILYSIAGLVSKKIH